MILKHALQLKHMRMLLSYREEKNNNIYND